MTAVSGSWGHAGEVPSPICCPNCGSARVDTAPQSGAEVFRCLTCGLTDDALAFRPNHLPVPAPRLGPAADHLSIRLASELKISVALARRLVAGVLSPSHLQQPSR